MSRTGRIVFLSISSLLLLFLVVGHLLGDGRDEGSYRGLKTFTASLKLIRGQYVDEVEMGELIRGAYRGLLEGLDPFSSYMDPHCLAELGAVGGEGDVGITFAKPPNGYARIVSVRYGSPAWEAKLRPGRWVELVGEHSTKEMSLLEAEALLRGPVGSTVRIALFEREEGEEPGIELTRENLGDTHLAVEEEPAEEVLHVRLLDLEKGAADALKRVLRERREGSRGLVLDLRTNPGGRPEEAAAVADLFLDGGAIFTLTAKSGERTLRAGPGREWELPVSLLVGPATLGEAEILTASLREQAGAKVVGATTFGKGFNQETIPLSGGASLRLSTREMKTAQGTQIQGDGVEPDVEVEYRIDVEEGEDEALGEAVEALDGEEEIAGEEAA